MGDKNNNIMSCMSARTLCTTYTLQQRMSSKLFPLFLLSPRKLRRSINTTNLFEVTLDWELGKTEQTYVILREKNASNQ